MGRHCQLVVVVDPKGQQLVHVFITGRIQSLLGIGYTKYRTGSSQPKGLKGTVAQETSQEMSDIGSQNGDNSSESSESSKTAPNDNQELEEEEETAPILRTDTESSSTQQGPITRSQTTSAAPPARSTRSQTQAGQSYNTTETPRHAKEPRGWNGVANHPEREKWEEAMKKEALNFLKRGVWKKVKLQDVPKGRTPVRTKWIFKVKHEHDGSLRYKSRNVVLGYALRPEDGDVYETFSPVAADVSIRIVLGYALYRNWDCHMIDVQAAFLESPIEEDLWIFWPEGLTELGIISEEDAETTCAKLERAQYGIGQAPRCWYKKLADTLKRIGLERSICDPCVYYGKDQGGNINLVLIVVVDDTLCIGETETILKFKEEFKKNFTVTDLGRLKKHLGVWYERKKDEEGEYFELSMTDFAKEMIEDYEKANKGPIKEAASPAVPGSSLIKQKEHAPLRQKEYRSFVGRIMWYIRRMAPQCCNAMRELASFMENPGPDHWKALDRTMGYIKKRIDRKIKLRKPKELRHYSLADSNYALNTDDRKSISSMIVTFGGMPVLITSKTQKTVTLSSSEAELIALTLCAQETKFAQTLLEEMDNRTVRPVIIYEDNTGAIYLAENQVVGGRTKHIDTRVHFLRDMVEENYVRILHVRSEDNYADIGSKNQAVGLFIAMEEQIENGMLLERSEETGKLQNKKLNRLTETEKDTDTNTDL